MGAINQLAHNLRRRILTGIDSDLPLGSWRQGLGLLQRLQPVDLETGAAGKASPLRFALAATSSVASCLLLAPILHA